MTLRRKLLSWFRRNRRDLPWRENREPYPVWISEVMLQQTVVAAVVPRFQRWMKRFPSIQSLAKASEREVLLEWEGLGYYRRARNLHRAARMILGMHGGRLPRDYDALRALPGVGDYTASAILSLCFGLPYPVLDANVRRLAMRMLAIPDWNAHAERTVRRFLAGEITPRSAGAFNEALMELGETVCLPRRPRCANCPISDFCLGFRKNIAQTIPRRRRRETIARSSAVLLFAHRREFFVLRSNGELLGGLYGFPKVEAADRTMLRGEIERMAGRRGEVRVLKPRLHSYTRYRDRLEPYLVRLRSRTRFSGEGVWLSAEELERVPFPSVYRKIIAEAVLEC